MTDADWLEWYARKVERLEAELAGKDRVIRQLADRLAACSDVLGRAAERGKVCRCHQPQSETHSEDGR